MIWSILAGLILAGSVPVQAQSNAPVLASADSTGALKAQAEESFSGRFANTKLMVQLKPATNTWQVTITAAHLRLAYKGELHDGKIPGTCNQVPIETSIENNVLKLTTGAATTYLRRVDLPKLEGIYQSENVKLDFRNAQGGTNGLVYISGKTLPFTASEYAGDLVGVYTNGGQAVSFVLADELVGLWFQSENISEQVHWIRPHPPMAQFDHANRWTNSLGMVLVSVPGIQARFSIWDTRVQDYEAYSRSVAGVDALWKSGETDGIHITNWAMHPVTMINWNDAKTFCRWLTEQERAEGLLTNNQIYRLPTNEEWSMAMGLTGSLCRSEPIAK